MNIYTKLWFILTFHHTSVLVRSSITQDKAVIFYPFTLCSSWNHLWDFCEPSLFIPLHVEMWSALLCCMSIHVETLNPFSASRVMLAYKYVKGHSLTENSKVVNKEYFGLPVCFLNLKYNAGWQLTHNLLWDTYRNYIRRYVDAFLKMKAVAFVCQNNIIFKTCGTSESLCFSCLNNNWLLLQISCNHNTMKLTLCP